MRQELRSSIVYTGAGTGSGDMGFILYIVYTGTGIGAGDRSCIHEQGQDQGTGGGYNMYIMYTVYKSRR